MKGGTLIRSANNQILDEFEAVIIQPPVLRELRVDSMLNCRDSEGSNYSLSGAGPNEPGVDARPTFRALRRSCDHALREDS